MSLTSGLRLLLALQSALLAQAGGEPQAGMPLRYYLIDLGELDGPRYYQDWGINNEGNILGFHKRMVLPDGSPADIMALAGTEEPPEPPRGRAQDGQPARFPRPELAGSVPHEPERAPPAGVQEPAGGPRRHRSAQELPCER